LLIDVFGNLMGVFTTFRYFATGFFGDFVSSQQVIKEHFVSSQQVF